MQGYRRLIARSCVTGRTGFLEVEGVSFEVDPETSPVPEQAGWPIEGLLQFDEVFAVDVVDDEPTCRQWSRSSAERDLSEETESAEGADVNSNQIESGHVLDRGPSRPDETSGVVDEQSFEKDITERSATQTVHIGPAASQSTTDAAGTRHVDELPSFADYLPQFVEWGAGSAPDDHFVGLEVEHAHRCANGSVGRAAGDLVVEEPTGRTSEHRHGVPVIDRISHTVDHVAKVMWNGSHQIHIPSLTWAASPHELGLGRTLCGLARSCGSKARRNDA